MKKLEFTVSFITPAFLGNADQQAQWRTPPFKALIRQWWRVVKATDIIRRNNGISPGDLHVQVRNFESRFFGAVAEEAVSSRGKSCIGIKLSKWNPGTMTEWQAACDKVYHPEVGNDGREIGSDLYQRAGSNHRPAGRNDGRKIGSDLYLAYGPLTYNDKSRNTAFGTVRGTNIKRTAIMPVKEEARLVLFYPEEHESEIQRTMQLIAWFGTVGSRSRNGWGSLILRPVNNTTAYFLPTRNRGQ